MTCVICPTCGSQCSLGGVGETKYFIPQRCEKLKEAQQQLDRAFQVLELHGVPRQRARFVGNGIEVLVTRLSREIEEAQHRNAAHDAKVAAEAKAEALEEAEKLCDEKADAYQKSEGFKFQENKTDAEYGLRNFSFVLQQKAAEYRAKATEFGRKE